MTGAGRSRGAVGAARRMLPNALSTTRAVVSPLLPLFAKRRSRTALLLLVGCGVSDVLDGMLARRWGVANSAGARLDSAADAVFFPSLCVAVLRVLPPRDRCAVAALAAPNLALRVASAAARRHRGVDPERAHTSINRAAGAALAVGAALVLGGKPAPVLIPGALLGWAAAVQDFAAASARTRPARGIERAEEESR